MEPMLTEENPKQVQEDAEATTPSLLDVKPLEASFAPMPQFPPVNPGVPSTFPSFGPQFYASPVPFPSEVAGVPRNFGFFGNPHAPYQTSLSHAIMSPFAPKSFFMPHPSTMYQYSFQFSGQNPQLQLQQQQMQQLQPQQITSNFSEDQCAAIEQVLSKMVKPKVSYRKIPMSFLISIFLVFVEHFHNLCLH